MRFSSSRSAPVLGVAALLVLSGCSEDAADLIDQDAAALADALTSGDFGGVEMRSGGVAELVDGVENLRGPLDDLSPEITVGEIELDEPEEESPQPPTADVQLHHSWDLEPLGVEDEAWEYETAATFIYSEDAESWQLDAGTEVIYPSYGGYETVGLNTVAAERGRIMDDAGTAMVYERDVLRIGIDKTQLGEGTPDEDTQRAAAEELAELVGIDAEEYAESVLAHGDEAFVEAIVHRRDSDAVTAAELEAIPGAVAHEDQMPLAESSDFAPLLLGRVGPVTADHLEEDPTLLAGDMVGMGGLQSVHDERLRGAPGISIEMDGQEVFSLDAEAGEDLETSLDPRMQDLAQELVDDQDVTASLVAVRPSDGGILASASHNPDGGQVEHATQSTYAPGSTFKVVSALAMLRDGLTPDSQVSCPNSTVVHGQEFGNVPGYPSEYVGTLPFRDAVAASCNTLFAAAYDDVTSEEVAQAALDLGLDNDMGIGVPAIKGSVPDDSEGNLHAANLFGQGEVEASVLGMATVAASIGAGQTVHPHLAVPDEPREGEGLSEEEGEDLLTLMTDTVSFGTLESMEEVPGEHVYAKTGTAEAGDGDDTYAHTWVIAVQGDLAVAIFLEEGEFGGSTNGPLLHEFLSGAHDILGS
ncbi:penicillin-binding transpeptidase domain-containing protein [Nesterenkonia cremea]|uniref:Beta-lactamase n=1 Tax=Nesterenkonia cremea TaxID=1882340 RepID=A0A917EQW9_9MICC|nr:penicillin-binding transpeptidase domain-containing protein [Nesterenkonia cremea]GGE73319.1 cell division protein FtsI [Nesterenkonia cremea]